MRCIFFKLKLKSYIPIPFTLYSAQPLCTALKNVYTFFAFAFVKLSHPSAYRAKKMYPEATQPHSKKKNSLGCRNPVDSVSRILFAGCNSIPASPHIPFSSFETHLCVFRFFWLTLFASKCIIHIQIWNSYFCIQLTGTLFTQPFSHYIDFLLRCLGEF